jgi:hypothetical protein
MQRKDGEEAMHTGDQELNTVCEKHGGYVHVRWVHVNTRVLVPHVVPCGGAWLGEMLLTRQFLAQLHHWYQPQAQ